MDEKDGTDNNSLNAQETIQELSKQLKSLNMEKVHGKSTMSDYKFWNTQPVARIGETYSENCEIEPDATNVRAVPLQLPASFEWCDVDLTSESDMQELYVLLRDNYVEDIQSTFRFDYSHEILRWALMPPGWKKCWHTGIRTTSNKKLVAFISAIPVTLKIYDKVKETVEINFLCVHKKLRTKRLAPVLIKEITRRAHVNGIFQAIYTAGTKLPTPFSEANYFHRTLNAKKLIETGFSYLKRNMTLARTIKLFKLADQPQLPGFRVMQEKDVPEVYELWKSFMQNFDLYQLLTEQELAHYLLPRANDFFSFVLEDPDSKKIRSFVSFYTITNGILCNSKHNSLLAAFLWLYSAESDDMLRNMVNDAMISARNAGCDVFNCLDVMKNGTFLEDLKFNSGDGVLNFYLYNWKCPVVSKEKEAFLVI